MSAITSIQWTDRTWNPVRGCSRVSAGCDNCYAMNMAHRFSGAGKPFEGLTTIRRGKVDWTGVARFMPDQLGAPLKWRKPVRVFVNSMSDLFHPSLSNEEIAAVFGVMAACPQHTFQVLTKQPKRAAEWFKWLSGAQHQDGGPGPATVCGICASNRCADVDYLGLPEVWPLPNVHLGVSAENQKAADERIPILLTLPVAVRFVSAEPLLGPIDFRGWGDLAPAKPGPEWDSVKWPDYPWEPWIPESMRKLISDFWSESYGRGPKSWLSDHVVQRMPRTGAIVTAAPDHNGWSTTDKMAVGGVTGRYVHLWNNIGRVIADDGTIVPMGGGYGSGWFSKWLTKSGEYRSKLNWVIAGGESGPGARPCDVAWLESIVKQCKEADVPCFVKQVGALWYDSGRRRGARGSVLVPACADWEWAKKRDKKGGDPSEWPESLRVRQFPEAAK